MELVLLLLLGGGIYLFVKGKARWNMELMRAHVFLDALERGEPLDEANSYARLVMGFEAPKGIIHLARMRMHDEFDGKWSHMVGSAYGQGMAPKLSGFEQEFFELKPRYSGPVATPNIPIPDWVRPFVLFYIRNEEWSEEAWPDGTPKVTEGVFGLLRSQVSQQLQLSLHAALRLYMGFAYSDVQQYGIGPVVMDARSFLQQAMKSFSDPAILRSYLQKQSVLHTGSPMPPGELTALLTACRNSMAESTELGLMLRDAMLHDLAEEQFKATHDKSFDAFRAEYLAFHAQAVGPTNPMPIVDTGQQMDFDRYYAAYISELKRLAGIAADELHPAEIMEDDGPRRAYRDGVPPYQLAAMHHENDFGRQAG